MRRSAASADTGVVLAILLVGLVAIAAPTCRAAENDAALDGTIWQASNGTLMIDSSPGGDVLLNGLSPKSRLEELSAGQFQLKQMLTEWQRVMAGLGVLAVGRARRYRRLGQSSGCCQ